MPINPAMTTMALAVLMLGGLSSPGQEPVAPTNEAPAAQASAPQAAAPASGNSKVRIIRLSEIKGQVQFDRNIGNGF